MLVWTLTLALIAGASASSTRIVGGEITSIDHFPSVVQVDSNSGEFWQQNCGGSIITSSHILSSAQCLLGGYYNIRQARIRAGATYSNNGGVIHYFENVVIHPRYIENGFINNIGIARLASSLVFTPTVQRTAIPPQDTVIPDGLPVTQVGWGRTKFMGERSDVLRYVDVMTVNHDLCLELYVPADDWPTVGSEILCAGLLNVDGKGSCFGDHGGPLLYGAITVGVIYGGEGCGNSTFPSWNTNVAKFTDWIVATAV